eukprot:TRINITY_DN4466_c1_g1_i1.p1 TRINITY_DN4466_c1_g1~~TRINITY_DN4466_c1_g1_i1.p1  ORF type:complete len:612 (-),score=116.17 TRINITY_DN4466_c1_g1_i1:71-1906(-)
MDHINNNNNNNNGGSGSTSSQPLFLIGNIGADHIVRSLSQTTNPFQTIEKFQKEYMFGKENALPALSLLDLHNVPRAEVYLRILERLKLNLLKQIETTHDDKNLEALLEQTFPYISFEELRAVPFAIMKQMPEVPPRFLRKLIDTKLYEHCPIEVKRQMWLMDESLFRTKVDTLLNDYIKSVSGEGSGSWMQPNDLFEIISSETTLLPAKRRESSEVLKELIHFVGKSVALYNMILHFFRTLFVSNKKPALCNLRADFLMALHDANVSEIYELDPCHKFAWTLDACVRDSVVEIRRIRELQTFFSTVSSTDPIIGDLAMITANPFTSHMLVRTAFATLVTVVQKEAIPKDDETLNYVTWLLSISLQAHSMIQTQNFSLPKQTKEISQTLYPLLAFKIMDDQSRKPNQPPEELDPELEMMFRSNNIARKIILYYILTRVAQRDLLAVEQLIHFILNMNDISDDLDFFQSLVTQVINCKDLRMAALVIDSTLLPIRNTQREHSTFIHRNLVRFLVESHLRLPTKELVNYINKFISGSHDDKVTQGYRTLLEKASPRLNNKNVPLLFNYLYDNVVENSEVGSSSRSNITQATTPPISSEDDPMSDEEEEEEEEE